jgi:hypothetical protein
MSALPQFTLNYELGKEPQIVSADGVGPCGCPRGAPLPEITLAFARREDAATLATLNADGRSFDTMIIGGRHSTDDQYGGAPPMRESPDEDLMSDDDFRRIGLAGRGSPLETPTLVFHRGADGQTISEIA